MGVDMPNSSKSMVNVGSSEPCESAARSRARRYWRLGVLLLLGVFVISGAWGYTAYFLSRPSGEGPAGPSVPREPFEVGF